MTTSIENNRYRSYATKWKEVCELAGVEYYMVSPDDVVEALAKKLKDNRACEPTIKAADGPQPDPRDVKPRNHIHIPAIKRGPVLIDGHPVNVKAGGVELQGIGNPNEITAVTLTIFPETITIDGDLKDAYGQHH